VGLPAGPRRRAAELRREEVAVLATVLCGYRCGVVVWWLWEGMVAWRVVGEAAADRELGAVAIQGAQLEFAVQAGQEPSAGFPGDGECQFGGELDGCGRADVVGMGRWSWGWGDLGCAVGRGWLLGSWCEPGERPS
jgi:hypothetical protein